MDAHLSELIKEIGRIAETHENNAEWYKVADFCKVMSIFENPELDHLEYNQFSLVVEIYAVAYSQCVIDKGDDWGTVRMFANMILEADRVKVENSEH